MMQLKQASLSDGYQWFVQGFRLFQKNRVAMLLLTTTYMCLSQLLVSLPLIGGLIFVLLIPAAFLGLMSVCRAVSMDASPKQALVVTYTQLSSLSMRRLWGLGGIHMIGTFLVGWGATQLVDTDSLIAVMLQQKTISAPEMMGQLYMLLIAFYVLYLPVVILLWFAPLLVAWQNMTVTQSLFFSYLACWRNRAAFLVYLLVSVFGGVLVPLIAGHVFLSLGLNSLLPFLSFLLVPYWMVFLTVFYCSVYATWEGCFQGK